jgi:hypothetical protein
MVFSGRPALGLLLVCGADRCAGLMPSRHGTMGPEFVSMDNGMPTEADCLPAREFVNGRFCRATVNNGDARGNSRRLQYSDGEGVLMAKFDTVAEWPVLRCAILVRKHDSGGLVTHKLLHPSSRVKEIGNQELGVGGPMMRHGMAFLISRTTALVVNEPCAPTQIFGQVSFLSQEGVVPLFKGRMVEHEFYCAVNGEPIDHYAVDRMPGTFLWRWMAVNKMFEPETLQRRGSGIQLVESLTGRHAPAEGWCYLKVVGHAPPWMRRYRSRIEYQSQTLRTEHQLSDADHRSWLRQELSCDQLRPLARVQTRLGRRWALPVRWTLRHGGRTA